MIARIFRPSKNAMQSGVARSQTWVLEFEPSRDARTTEPLMGWTSSSNTKTQIRLTFETRDEAVAYAMREGIAYRVLTPQEPARRTMAYSDNFRSDRIGTWTH